jgi:hypothetical protein
METGVRHEKTVPIIRQTLIVGPLGRESSPEHILDDLRAALRNESENSSHLLS